MSSPVRPCSSPTGRNRPHLTRPDNQRTRHRQQQREASIAQACHHRGIVGVGRCVGQPSRRRVKDIQPHVPAPLYPHPASARQFASSFSVTSSSQASQVGVSQSCPECITCARSLRTLDAHRAKKTCSTNSTATRDIKCSGPPRRAPPLVRCGQLSAGSLNTTRQYQAATKS